MHQDTPWPKDVEWPKAPWNDAKARAALRALFDTAVAAADPRVVLAPPSAAKAQIRPMHRRRRRKIRGGDGRRAGGGLAGRRAGRHGCHALWPCRARRGGSRSSKRRIRFLTPTASVGLSRLLERVKNLTKDDLVIALMSGGASALLAAPVPGLTLADKQAVNRALLACGANITEMNAVRKHLSAIKGGRLAAAASPARVVTLAISDVPGDDPAVIGSGPTVPDATTFAEARALIARYGITLPQAVAARLAQDDDETPKPGSLANVEFRMIATPMMALTAMAEKARSFGLTPADPWRCAGRRGEPDGDCDGWHRPVRSQPWSSGSAARCSAFRW